jgi:hypothetical protein
MRFAGQRCCVALTDAVTGIADTLGAAVICVADAFCAAVAVLSKPA